MLRQHLQRNRAWHLPGVMLRLLGSKPARYLRSGDDLLGGFELLDMPHHALPEPADGLPLVLAAVLNRALQQLPQEVGFQDEAVQHE